MHRPHLWGVNAISTFWHMFQVYTEKLYKDLHRQNKRGKMLVLKETSDMEKEIKVDIAKGVHFINTIKSIRIKT